MIQSLSKSREDITVRKIRYSLDRAFVATIMKVDGTSLTTTIYGPTASEAEALALCDSKVAWVIVRSEIR